MALSLRLQTLLDRCEPGLPLWDLCCDHGLLGLAALESGKFSEVIFNDAVTHVIDALKPRLEGIPNARTIISLAEDIGEPLTGNLILAGVGGEKISKILSRQASEGRLKARRVVVCPEKHAGWLGERTFPGLNLVEHFAIPHGRGTREILFFRSSHF